MIARLSAALHSLKIRQADLSPPRAAPTLPPGPGDVCNLGYCTRSETSTFRICKLVEYNCIPADAY